MLYAAIKVLLTAVLVVTISEVAKRSSALGGIIASLPLTSLLAFIWLYGETGDTSKIANLSTSIFWYVLPSLPMFLLVPALMKRGVTFWPALGAGCALTIGLYLAMTALGPRFGLKL